MSSIANWQQLIVSSDSNIGRALAVLPGTTSDDFVLLVDSDGKFAGLVAERSLRRALLDGWENDDPLASLSEYGSWLRVTENSSQIHFKELGAIVCLTEGKITGVLSTRETPPRDNLFVIMVGGAGTRLKPLTDNCPKPLLPIHGKPLLQITVERLRALGYRNICLTVGYRAEQIMSYFGNGDKWGVNITYVHERERLGTCGALRLLPHRPQQPIVVMNGDLITDTNFDKLIAFHKQMRACATVAAHKYQVDIPYGLLTTDGDFLRSVVEKPTRDFWINAGIYVLDPSMVDLIPPAQPFDMPSLLQLAQHRGKPVSVYALRERWIDIGSVHEYERANRASDVVVPMSPAPDATSIVVTPVPGVSVPIV